MITIISPLYPPANKGGGPIKSVSGVASLLENEGMDYKVITNNSDLDGRILEEDKYMPKTVYLKSKGFFSYIKHLKKSDVIWINTLYNINFAFKPLLYLLFIKKTTLLITPRGQLLHGSINKRKKIYLKFFLLLLNISPHKVIIHFTHIDEKEKSYGCFSRFEYLIFPNTLSGEVQEKSLSENNSDKEKFKLGFFGRINPKKNIHFIINILPSLPQNVTLQIHGANEDISYKKELDKFIVKFKLENRVSYHGYYDSVSFFEKAKNVDVIVVPSLSENFCHVFFEAIEARKIVLASNGLPWEEANDYVDNTILSLDNEVWIDRIKEIYKMSNEEQHQEINKLIDFYTNIKMSIKKQTLDNFKKITTIQ